MKTYRPQLKVSDLKLGDRFEFVDKRYTKGPHRVVEVHFTGINMQCRIANELSFLQEETNIIVGNFNSCKDYLVKKI